jgi:hypothetical protein
MTHTKDEALKLAKSWFEANTYGDEAVEVYEAIEQALAAQPAPVQPVAQAIIHAITEYGDARADQDANNAPTTSHERLADCIRLIRDAFTPPVAQPAVPDAFGTREGEHPQYIQGWNDCRSEMLRGNK